MALFTENTKVIIIGDRAVSYTHLDVYKRQVVEKRLKKEIQD